MRFCEAHPDGDYHLDLTRSKGKFVGRSERYVLGCNYLFGIVYSQIMRDTGQDRQSIHSEMKYMFLKGFKEIETKDGSTMVFEYVRSLKHEHGDVEDNELWDFIYQVRDFALHTLSIVTPDPDPTKRTSKY